MRLSGGVRVPRQWRAGTRGGKPTAALAARLGGVGLGVPQGSDTRPPEARR
jgi:hypothetical protein